MSLPCLWELLCWVVTVELVKVCRQRQSGVADHQHCTCNHRDELMGAQGPKAFVVLHLSFVITHFYPRQSFRAKSVSDVSNAKNKQF